MLLFSLITFCIFNCVRCDSEIFRFGRTSNREATIHSLSSQYSVSGAALGHNENQAVASQQPHSPDIRLQKLTSLAKSFGGDASKGQQAISLWKSLLSIVLFDENASDKFMWDKSVVNMATKNGVVSLVKVESAVGSLKAKYYLVEDKSIVVDCFFNLAILYFNNGKHNEGIIMMSNVLKVDKLNLDALIKRGEFFSALKRHSEVIADMDKVIELSSTQYLELFFRRGSAKRSMNDLLGAWADFNRSLGLPAAEQSRYACVVILTFTYAFYDIYSKLSYDFIVMASQHTIVGMWRQISAATTTPYQLLKRPSSWAPPSAMHTTTSPRHM
jgi:hypothetical protein